MVASMTFTRSMRSKSGTIVVSKVNGVTTGNMGVKCANIGKNGAIMRRFT